MNNLLKRMGAGLLALLIVISLLPMSISAAPASSKVHTTPTGYDSASDVVYKKSTVGGKQIVANWGARGEDCEFLSTYATNYYINEYSFATLSSLSGGTSQSNAPSSTLFKELQELMSSTHTFYTYYDGSKNVRDYYMYTDCVSNDTSKVALLYRCVMVSSAWDNGNTWNQEHTWPKSKLSSDKEIGDIMQLRPANPSENSSRSNTAYGESSGYYNPGPSVRGDCARTMLYMYVRWGATSKMWGSSGVIESLPLLLTWMKEDPVDTWEMGRNDAVQSITGTRNVFVDYPEFAWLLFGQDVPEGITTPSGNDGATANPGGNTGSGGSSSGSNNNSGNTANSGYTQVSSLKDGDKVVIVNPASNMALSSTKAGFYNIGVNVSAGFSTISNNEIFTVKKNSDGSWSFTSGDGKKLAMADEYSSLNETGSNDQWTLSSAGSNQFYLLNKGRDLYLEWYASKNNWSAYKPDNLNADYALAFYVKTSSGSNSGSSNNSSGTTPPATQPPATQPPATQPPATQPVETQPVETQPPMDTTPPASNPGTSEGTQTSTPATQPGQPAPLPTASVNPDDFIIKQEDSSLSVSDVLIIIAAVLVVGAGVAVGVVIVIKKKKNQ